MYFEPWIWTAAVKGLRFKLFDLENLHIGHRVHHWQWAYSMADNNVYKSHTWEFSRYIWYISRNVVNLKIYTDICQGYNVQYSQWRISTSIKVILAFLLAITIFPILYIFSEKILWFWNIGQGHNIQHLQYHHLTADTWLPI